MEKRIRGDSERLRGAHREIRADIDAMQTRMDSARSSDRLRHAHIAPDRSAANTADRTQAARSNRRPTWRYAGCALQQIQAASNVTPIHAATRGPMDLVREALLENRIELHLQPIVNLPQRQTAFYEGFTRLAPADGMILPKEFLPAAEQANLLGMIDNMLLFRCVQIVRRLLKQDRRIGVFCNVADFAGRRTLLPAVPRFHARKPRPRRQRDLRNPASLLRSRAPRSKRAPWASSSTSASASRSTR